MAKLTRTRVPQGDAAENDQDPAGFDTDGLPIGCQFVARSGDEATLFRLAAQLEDARPWFDRRPPGLGSIG